MTYPESVRYLYSLGNELKAGAKFGLERMEVLCAALDHPEKEQAFVHVAGTNGKGSTCAMIASVLNVAGERAGLYTSPHLISPTERIQINGTPIDLERFSRAFAVVHEAAETLITAGKIDAHPSYFETVTVMALLLFRESCDVSVIEVGLGGRLDATNVIIPRLCILTPIAFDHEAYLGNTIELIAAEKAGILKSSVPVVVARQHPAAMRVIEDRARVLECKVLSEEGSALEISSITAEASSFRLDGTGYRCPLPGRHQIQNAVVAVLACRQLEISEEAIREGVSRTTWAGRLEKMQSRPDLILDGAHNPAGAAALRAHIQEFYADRPVWIVYGAMRDKAVEEVSALLFPLAARLILTMPDVPRALRPEAILAITDHPQVRITRNTSDALAIALDAPEDTVVFLTGSLFLVGEVRAQFAKKSEFIP